MPMPVVASRANATRTTSGSCRRCTAVPTATPAMARPDRGRTSGGRGGAAAGWWSRDDRRTARTGAGTGDHPGKRTRVGWGPSLMVGGPGARQAGAMTSASPPPPPAPPLEPPVWQPPPPPPGAWARPQLRRSRSDKVIGGVGGGLAEYSGIDALLWRVGFVALALAGGTGVFVYLLLWLLMPADRPPARRSPPRRPPCAGRSHRPGRARRSRDHPRRAADRGRRAGARDARFSRLGPRRPGLLRRRRCWSWVPAWWPRLRPRPDGPRGLHRPRRGALAALFAAEAVPWDGGAAVG